MKNAIGYCRVSRKKQQQKGHSLQAQHAVIHDFAARNDMNLIELYTETDAGWRNGRLGLKQALADCKKHDAVLLIPKLDRLSRRAAFIANLLESTIEVIPVDYPNANKIMKLFLAVMGEFELDMIRTRIREGLAAAKQKGVELGWYGRLVTSKLNQFHADMFACRMKPIIDDIKAKGARTVRAIAAELNRRKIPTYHEGHKWHINTVFNLLKRLRRDDKKEQ